MKTTITKTQIVIDMSRCLFSIRHLLKTLEVNKRVSFILNVTTIIMLLSASMLIAQSNSPAIEISPSGNVGIGTAPMTPNTILDINGNTQVQGSVTAKRLLGEGTVPPGTITMWSGTPNSSDNFNDKGLGVPGTAYEGWAICNGAN